MSEIKEVKDCSLILSNEDEAIDHSLIRIGENVKVMSIDDNHRVKNVMKLMSIIKKIIKKKRSRKKDSVVVKITFGGNFIVSRIVLSSKKSYFVYEEVNT